MRNLVALKYLAAVNRSVLSDDTDPNLRFRYIDISQVDSTGSIDVEAAETMRFEDAPSRARRLAPAGATIVSTVRTYLRAIAQVPAVDERLVFSTGFAVLEPTSGESRFFSYACRSDQFVNEVVARSTGVSYPAINPSDLGGIPLPAPPLEEQRRIADFLDDRVARIDQIIAARCSQLESLTLARASALAAALRHADGRPVPLWLAVGRITDGAHVSPDTTNGIHPFVSTRDITSGGEIDIAGALKTSAESFTALSAYGCRPKVGDLLFSKDGTIGRTAIVTNGESFVVASSLIIIRPNTQLASAEFLELALTSHDVLQQIDAYVRGAGLPRLSIANLKRLRLSLPSLAEQAPLVRRFRAERSAHQRLAAGVKLQISLLQEYKQSLITAAVTGELDVTTASTRIPEQP